MAKQPCTALQLYSVREELDSTPATCIKTLSEIGFTDAEGYDLMHLASIEPLLNEYGIEVKSSFILWSHITGRYDLAEQINYPWMPTKKGIEYAIEQALELGLDTVVSGYLLPEERNSVDCYKRLADNLNSVGEKCKQSGLSLLYHNHCFEFTPYKNDFIPYFFLLEQTDPKYVNFEVDTLWAHLAGHPASSLFPKLGSRLKQLHLKTSAQLPFPIFDETQVTEKQQDYCLGTGIVDIDEVMTEANKIGVQRYFIEQEYSEDIYGSLSNSLSYLQRSF